MCLLAAQGYSLLWKEKQEYGMIEANGIFSGKSNIIANNFMIVLFVEHVVMYFIGIFRNWEL